MTTLTPRGPERRSGVERRTVDIEPRVLGKRDRRSGRERRSGTDRRSGADGQSHQAANTTLTPIRRPLINALKWLLRQFRGPADAELPKTDLFTLASDYLRQIRDLAPSSSESSRGLGWFDVMVPFFLWKQIDHADAILRLGVHRDVELIARSMIEGLCQLKWARQDPDVRADRWRRFAWVYEWRLLQKKLRAGHQVPAAERRRIETEVQQDCKDFRRKARPGADPYVQHWSCESVKRLCAAVGGTPLYEWPYAHFSDWHHWSPGGFLRAIELQDNRVRFTQPQPADVVPAYVVAFQCLYETVHLANNTFKLGLDAQLAAIHKGYLRDLAPARTDIE